MGVSALFVPSPFVFSVLEGVTAPEREPVQLLVHNQRSAEGRGPRLTFRQSEESVYT